MILILAPSDSLSMPWVRGGLVSRNWLYVHVGRAKTRSWVCFNGGVGIAGCNPDLWPAMWDGFVQNLRDWPTTYGNLKGEDDDTPLDTRVAFVQTNHIKYFQVYIASVGLAGIDTSIDATAKRFMFEFHKQHQMFIWCSYAWPDFYVTWNISGESAGSLECTRRCAGSKLDVPWVPSEGTQFGHQ